MAANTISKFGSDYLQLGLRIDKHQNEYVDYYYGPKEIKEKVDTEATIPPIQLLEDCTSLQKQVYDQGFDSKREVHLTKMLDSMEIYIKTEIMDEGVPIEEALRIQNDMEIKPFKESEIEDLKDRFDEYYTGRGTLEERMNQLRKKRKVPKRKVKGAFKKGQKILKRRTEELFPAMLPEKERTKVKAVSGVDWLSYDWYKGNFFSVIDIRKKGMYWTGVLRICAHESYPGHHTQFVVAEDKLYNEKKHFEKAILLYCSPSMIMCEGISSLSLNVLFSAQEQEKIALSTFCPKPKDGPTVELLVKQNLARKKLPMLDFNAAYRAHVDGWEPRKVRNYIKDFGLWDTKSLDRKIEMIYNPIYKISVFSPQAGKQLIMKKFGEYPSPKDYRSLLENPVLPSDLL